MLSLQSRPDFDLDNFFNYVMRKTYQGRKEELEFHLQKRQSRRVLPIIVTDLDFADDLALITEQTEQAQEVLTRLEQEAGKAGLHCNAKKTEIQTFNHDTPIIVNSRDGTKLKIIENFKGSWMESTDKDFKVRKALAWSACHKLRKIWSSTLSKRVVNTLKKDINQTVYCYRRISSPIWCGNVDNNTNYEKAT